MALAFIHGTRDNGDGTFSEASAPADSIGGGGGSLTLPIVVGTGAAATGGGIVAIGEYAEASGANAIAIGTGESGTPYQASGETSSAIGGAFNVASGPNSNVLAGANNLSSGNSASVVGAQSAIASGDYSAVVGGIGNQSNGDNSVALGGGSNRADGDYSIASGENCLSSNRGERAHSAGTFADYGDCQILDLIARRETSDDTPTVLFFDGSSIPAVMTAGSQWTVEASISGQTDVAGAKRASCVRRFSIARPTDEASTVIDGSVQTVGTDTGTNAGSPPAGWSFAITADTTNGGPVVTVTGEVDTTIRWACHLRILQVIFP
jgi:hypothetical protein